MNNTATNTATCPTVRKQIGKTTYIVPVSYKHLDVYKRQADTPLWTLNTKRNSPSLQPKSLLWKRLSRDMRSTKRTLIVLSDVYKRQAGRCPFLCQ